LPITLFCIHGNHGLVANVRSRKFKLPILRDMLLLVIPVIHQIIKNHKLKRVIRL
jgi:hypothetical protein